MRERLDQIVIRHGWVTDTQLSEALVEQKHRGTKLGSALVELGFLTENQVAEALAEQHDTPRWNPQNIVPQSQALALFREDWLRPRGMLPLAYDESSRRLIVALADPTDLELRDEIRREVEVTKLVVVVAPMISLERLWKRYYPRDSKSKRERSTPAPKRRVIEGQLGLEFSFGEAVPESPERTEPARGPRVLIWLSQIYVSKLLKSLLEGDGCRVRIWDGIEVLQHEWDYLVYDHDNAASMPDTIARVRRELPQIQLIPRPSWIASLLRSPLSYEQLFDGYLNLAEHARGCKGVPKLDHRYGRYALAIARTTEMTSFEVDSLMVACELAPLFAGEDPDWDAIASELRCPYPAIDILRHASVPFDQCGAEPGQSTPDSPFAARICYLLAAFLNDLGKRRLVGISDLSEATRWLRARSGQQFDLVAVEALVRALREEVLDGCLPAGLAEAMLVADRPMDWSRLSPSLENDGWRVVIAEGAAEARKLVARRQPDVVVWAASGALEWIRWQTEKMPQIKSFLLLEATNPALERAGLEAGFEDVWLEPWDPGVAATKLRRAVSRATKADAGTAQGSLEQLSVVDLVNTLGAGGRSVVIELSRGREHATMTLWRGKIRHAASSDLEGDEAVYDAVTWEQGTFVLRPIDERPEPNCRASNAALLMEGCRRLDELTQVGTGEPA